MGGILGAELLDVFRELKKEQKTTFKDFILKFNEKIDRIVQDPAAKYSLIFPLNFNYVKRISSEIKGNRFEIISFKELSSKHFNIDKMIQAEENQLKKTDLKQLKEVFNENFSFFVIYDVYARSLAYADEYSTDTLLSLLGMLSLAKHYKVEPTTFIGIPTKISKLQLTCVLFFENYQYKTIGYFQRQLPELEKIEEPELNELYNGLKLLKKIKAPDIADILYNALKSYYEASTEDDVAHAFFKYWISIEFCLLKSEEIPETQIVKRLKNLNWKDKYTIHRLEIAYKKRNNFVHQLKTDITQSDRNFVKDISEELISFLLSKYNLFADKKELNLFYDFMSEDEKSLKKNKKMINLVQKLKRSA